MDGGNRIVLHGTVDAAPAFSHGSPGGDFHRTFVRVPRLSGVADIIPVLVRDGGLEALVPGTGITVRGVLRSYNNNSGTGRRLVLDVLAEDWLAEGGEPMNALSLSGTICREPVLRHTPMGRTICDMLLAVPRPSRGRADYLPVISWGCVAYECGGKGVGDALSLTGRFQSRPYRKVWPDGTASDMTAYEVSANRMSFDGGD